MKKLLALLLAVIMVLGLVACVQEQNPTDPPKQTDGDKTTTAAPTTTTEPEVEVKFPLEENITLAITMPANNSSVVTDFFKCLYSNKLFQDLQKMTNITLEIKPCASVDVLNAMIQTANYGDIIAVNGITGMNESVASELIATGKILAIEEYVKNPKVMPYFHKNVLAELPIASGTFTSPDGHLYILGSYSSEKSSYLESSIWINKTWLDKANMKVEDLATLEGVEKWFDYIAKNDMNGDGDTTDEIGYACYPMGGGMIEALLGMWGLPTKDATNENYITIEDGEVLFVPQTDAYKAFLTTLNKWWENGWMYKDYVLGHSTDMVNYNYYQDTYIRNNGNPERCAFWTGTGAPARNTGDKHPDPDNRCEWISILPPKVEGYETQWYMHPGFLGTKNMVMVASNTQYPAEACAFIDLFYDEEIYIRANYGESDSGWRIVDDEGKLSKDTTMAIEDQEALFSSGDSLLKTLMSWLPNALTVNMRDNILSTTAAVQAKRDALKFYQDAGVLNPDDEVWPRPYFATDAAEELGEIRGDIMTVVEKYRAEAISGKIDIDATWEDFQDTLKNDVETERFVEICQEAWDAYVSGQN